MENKLSQKQKELVERFGVIMEQSGFSPVQARILAILMVCDAAEMTFEELQQSLQVSKSAVSNALNALLLTKKIEYHTKPGDRKRYFSSRLGHQEDLVERFNKFLEVSAILKEILDQRSKVTKAYNQRLKHAIDFLEFLRVQLPDLYMKWARKQH